MPGIVAKLVMKGMMKSKHQNIHYIPRDYVTERENAKKQSEIQPLSEK